MRKLIYINILLVTLFAGNILAQEISGYLSAENRIFPSSGLFANQKKIGLSLSIKPEIYYEIPETDHSIILTPFLRIDQMDNERTHFDLREFYWQYYTEMFEFKVGIRQIFWGVTESSHLVDIINQTDLVEDLDGEQKLGQPAINLTWIQDWGTIDFYVLPYFRKRTFSGPDGRVRLPFEVNQESEIYESDSEEKHIDYAIRYAHTLGNFDLGLTYFYGTGREPKFETENRNGKIKLIPVYELINQIGVDLQYTKDGWLWKLESILRERNEKSFFAFTAGVEYTFPNINDSGLDIGIIGEYLFDDRDNINFAPNPFNNYTFVGSRLAFNDVQSTELLAGILLSNEGKGAFINVEGSRRIGESIKLNLKIRSFVNPSKDNFFYSFRKDGYSQVELEWYF